LARTLQSTLCERRRATGDRARKATRAIDVAGGRPATAERITFREKGSRIMFTHHSVRAGLVVFACVWACISQASGQSFVEGKRKSLIDRQEAPAPTE